MKLFFKHYWPLLILFALVLILFITNYAPGTFLTGWDNLHPEFNFGMNIQRSIFSVWEEYQGLGLLAGMAHASDLPHQLLLLVTSLVLPISLLRYFYHFLMFFAGIAGMYVFLAAIVLHHQEKGIKRSLICVAGALFYGFNLGIIQYFYVPFEPYSTFFGLFPWELLTVFLYLKYPKKSSLVALFLVNLIALPQAYVQTIFVVYLLCLLLILGIHFLQTKEIKKPLAILAVILGVNSFWLIPNLYFITHNLSVTQNAMQNQMATEKFFQLNKARGTILDFALLREFYYDFFDYSTNISSFDYLMKFWRQFDMTFLAQLGGYASFALVLLGLLQKNKLRPIFLALFGFCALLFLSDTIVFSQLNSLFRLIPLINQVFRNPFTKFIVPTAFTFSLGFALGIEALTHYVRKMGHLAAYGIIATALLLIGLRTFPVFTGHFISDHMRVALPQEYFDLFSYFKTQDPAARIMNLPQENYWGWDYYSFGARGSGFLWYGIQQPIIDRAFDVWSQTSEDYYWQLSYALEKRDQTLFDAILRKYQIRFIVFDKNTVIVDNRNAFHIFLDQEDLLSHDSNLTKEKEFGNIVVYKTNVPKEESTVFSLNTVPKTENNERFENKDMAFLTLGDYMQSHNTPDALFPFASLFTNRFQNEQQFKVEKEQDSMTISASLPKGSYTIAPPQFIEKERVIPVEILGKVDKGQLFLRFVPQTPHIVIGSTPIPDPLSSAFIDENPIPVAFNTSLFVSIDGLDFFTFENPSADYQQIGQAYLINNPAANYFRVYTDKDSGSAPIAPSDFDTAQPCTGSTTKGERAVVHLSSNNGTLVLEAKNAAACATARQTFVSPPSLLKVSFDYQSSSDEFPQYCIYGDALHTCLNKKDLIRTGFSNYLTPMVDYFENNSTTSNKLFFTSILDATSAQDKDKLKKITYKDISVRSYPLVGGAVIDLSSLTTVKPIDPVRVNLSAGQSIQVTIPLFSDYYSFENPIQKNIFKTSPVNYDTLMPGTFSRTADSKRQTVNLQAQRASSYLPINAQTANPWFGYIAFMDSNNEKGFPFTVDIFTILGLRTYTYTLASKSSDLSQNVFVLPPNYEFDQGITLLLGSNSYSSEVTSNTLGSISLYPLPYEYLTNILLTKPSLLASSGRNTLQVNHINESLYLVKGAKPNTTLVLSQSFDKGWHAYIVSKDNFLTRFFPFFSGKELTNHEEVNNWENGWNIQKSEFKSPLGPNTRGGQNPELIIVYLPQYLEYIGFLLLIGTGISIFFRKLRINQ